MRRALLLGVVLAVAMCATASAQVGFAPPSYVDTELAGGEPLALTDTSHGTIVYTSHEGTTHLYRPGFTSLAPVLLQYRNQVNIWYSADDAASWNRVSVPGGFATPPAQNTGFSDPDLTQDESGRIYNTGINLVNDAVFSSGDGGKTWDKGTANCHNGDRPWLAGAEKDHVYVATDTAEGTPSHTIFESTDGGNTCSQTGVPDGGTTAQDQAYGGYGKMYWDHARKQLVEPELFYDQQGNVNGIGAGTWAPGQPQFTPNKVADTTLFSHFPIVVIDGGGNYYLIWDSDDRANPDTTPGPCDDGKGKPLPNKIRMAVSKDGGKTWSAPSDIVAPQNARVLWPWAATGDAGKVSVVWYQTDKVVDVDCEASNVFIYAARIDNATEPSRAVTTINASKRPIHQNGICQGGTVCVASGKDRRLGDFFTNTVDNRGCEIIASGDTTQPDPNTGGPRAVSLPVILRQSSGPALVGGGDCGGARAPQGGNTGNPTCMDHTPPVSTLRQRALKRSATRVRARGVASDKGCKAAIGLAAAKGKVGQVLISLARTARHGCEFVNRKGKVTKRRSCRRAILMRARGHERWTFALRARLPRGNYRIDVRAVDITGNKETPNKRRNIVRFRVP